MRAADKQQTTVTERAAHHPTSVLGEKAHKCMEDLGLTGHWNPTDKKYKDAQKMLRARKFRKAIDHLEDLVVRRLFELQKFHVKGTSKSVTVEVTNLTLL